MKKSISILLVLMLSLGLLAGCGQEPAPSAEPEITAEPEVTAEPEAAEEPAEAPEAAEEAVSHEGEWSFTDSLGRTVSFSGPLTRVAPSGKMAQQCVYAVNPDVVIGLTNDLSKAEVKYYPESFTELPVFGTFYGKKANFNRESVLSAEPQVVIDVGEVKNNMAEDLDALQEQLGVPVIFVEASLTDMAPTFETLGMLLDMPEQGKILADYCTETISQAQEYAASIPEDQRVSVYYAMMDTGLTTSAQGDLHAEVIDLVGAVNVVPSGIGHSFVDIDMERLLSWDPEVILFAPNSIFATVGEDPVWAEVGAIQNGSYYEIPFGPYSWIDQPPAANRILGVKWLGNLLYPETFDYDMIQETVDFYDLFYHVELTEEAAHELLAHSTFLEK